MRVLFTGKHPPGGRAKHGGVLTWIETMAAEFRRLGHDCEIWGPELAAPEGRFDLGVISNATSTARAAQWCERVVGVSHGVIPDERPNPSMRSLYTSEEVRDHWGIGGAVLRQPLDLDFWALGEWDRAHRVTFYSYRSPSDLGIDKAAGAMGMEFVRLKSVTALEARAALQNTKIAVATGRAAVEAMASGAAVLICDWRVYQPPLLDPDTEFAMTRNYSGRGGSDPRKGDYGLALMAALGRGNMRQHVEKHHDVRKIAAQLLAYAGC